MLSEYTQNIRRGKLYSVTASGKMAMTAQHTGTVGKPFQRLLSNNNGIRPNLCAKDERN